MKSESKGKILVVDDEETLCDLLGDSLANDGYDITKTYDGQTAINLISVTDFDAAIIDLLLPQKNGMDILKYALENKKSAKIIMATGYGEISTAVEAITLGAFDFLQKPFDLNNLKLVLRKAVEIKKEEDLKRAPVIESQDKQPGKNTDAKPDPGKTQEEYPIPNINLTPEEEEKQKIISVLKETHWNKSKSADLLGMPLKSLYSKIKDYGLKP
jgi:DNA-binding NtrC family response regulator